MEEQSPAGSLIKLIFWATNTVFAIRAAKNVTVRSNTAEQHKHCKHLKVGPSNLKQCLCAQQIMDMVRDIEPRTSPLIATVDKVAHDSKPTAAARENSLLSTMNS